MNDRSASAVEPTYLERIWHLFHHPISDIDMLFSMCFPYFPFKNRRQTGMAYVLKSCSKALSITAFKIF